MPTAIAWHVPLRAPAKINLFLHVIGRRPPPDARHELQSLMRLVDWCDEITFMPSPRLDWQKPVAGLTRDNDLVLRAARLLQNHCGRKQGALIKIDKLLPMGSGLGGGSSDAALTLLALNQLWGLHCSHAELLALALRLGADVPFFLAGRSAWVEGVGERLTVVDLPPAWYVLLVPQENVATAEIFNAPSLKRNTDPIKITSYWQSCHNDLEPVTCALYPKVVQALAMLRVFGEARMSGSGGTVFIEVKNKSVAEEILHRISSQASGDGFVARVAAGLAHHPCHSSTLELSST